MSVSSKSEDSGAVELLVVESPYKENIPTFDDDDSFSFIVPGLSKTKRCPRSVLSKVSLLFSALFSGTDSGLCRYSKDSQQVEWIYKITESDEIYRNALLTWITFCFGKKATFSFKECPAALAVLIQLQLTCLDEVKTKIESFMKKIAEKNKEIGCKMLVECATVYDECHDDERSNIDVELARIVLSSDIVNKNKAVITELVKKNIKVGAVMLAKCAEEKAAPVDAELVKTIFTLENMKKHKAILVDECLMNLPEEYLDMIQFSEDHGDLSEFSLRLKYVKFHDLPVETKRTIMSHCNLGKLNKEELRELYSLGMFNDFSFVEQCHEETIGERDADKLRIQKLENKVEEFKEIIRETIRVEMEKKERKKRCQLLPIL